MDAVTITFLLIGCLGLALLVGALFFGDALGFGGADGVDGPLSMPSIAGFVGAFGFGGAIAASLTGGGALAVIVALVVGIAVAVPSAIGTLALARVAARMRTDATPTRGDLVGRLGVVVTPIPEQGYGEVRVSLGGQPVKLNARAEKAIALGANVFVIEAPSDTSVVVEETSPAPSLGRDSGAV
jgi:membrane protein implicated in regulation of membrane protease activity